MPHIGNFPPPGYPKPLSIPPSAFVPAEDVVDYQLDSYTLKNRTTLTLQSFYAPIFLPHKAIVTKLTFYGRRETTGATLKLTLAWAPRIGGPTVMAEVVADWTGGSGSGYDDTIIDPVIDNENRSYKLVVDIDPDAAVGDCYLYCAMIEWR